VRLLTKEAAFGSGMVKALFSPFVALAGMVGAGLGYVAKLVSGGGSAPAIADDSG
jgi:hypothetical protein